MDANFTNQLDKTEVQTSRRRRICVVVGDPSGDKHVAKVIEKLRNLEPNLDIFGIGGERMKAQGVEIMYNCNDFAVVGLDVLRNIKFFTEMKLRIMEEVQKQKPDLILLVDFGGHNVGFAGKVRKLMPDVPIYYFISPQVWGSRPWRVQAIKKSVTKMLVIFPFEEALYKRHNIPVSFVGHPITRDLPDRESLPSREQFCRSMGMDPGQPVIAIFPGSRKREILDILPISIAAMRWLMRRRPNVQFVLAQASDTLKTVIAETIKKEGAEDLMERNLFLSAHESNYQLMNACDLVWAKSGTTTLEATFLGKPMLIYYRALWLSYIVFALFKIVKRVGWPNLLAGYELVPELIQLDCRAEQLVRYTEDFLDVPELRREVSEKLLILKVQLGEKDYATEAAEEIQRGLPAAIGSTEQLIGQDAQTKHHPEEKRSDYSR